MAVRGGSAPSDAFRVQQPDVLQSTRLTLPVSVTKRHCSAVRQGIGQAARTQSPRELRREVNVG